MSRQKWLGQIPPWLWLTLLGLLWRSYLTFHYYGWEESDYGNLAMAQGVLSSNFTEYDLRHLPFYYFLSAVVLWVVGDAILATHLVSTLSGAISLGIAWFIVARAFGRREAWVATLLLCFQPEFALYASSSLREPVYTALMLGGCALLIYNRPVGGAVSTALSFLTRFDALGISMPVVALQTLRRGGNKWTWRHPLWGVLTILSAAVLIWSAYCGLHHGIWLFFLPTVEVNLETGGGRDVMSVIPRLWAGLTTVRALFFSTLPGHLSWTVWTFALLGLVLNRHSLLSRAPKGTLSLYLLMNTCFWLSIGLVAQHEPEHNLYWKWLYPLAPWWIFFASSGVIWLADRLIQHPRARGALLIALAASIAFPWQAETRRQLALSEQLYKPQVELARWVEASVPEETTLIFDNIPACYINRRPHNYHFLTWLDLDVTKADSDAFEALLIRENVQYVLWFREDWTQAPAVAPWLADVRVHTFGLLSLEPLRSDDAYGFVFYRVNRRSPDP